ncbi:MAG: MFS transporter [Candidatus Lokiarchaeota archaeon]|nr:MFS transporter [Candidatus Lokiarchaeota archaeon]
MEVPRPAAPRQLRGWRFCGYSLGILGQFLPSAFLNAYIKNYYIYTIGLDASLVTLVTGLGVLFNAISSPIFGSIVDNARPNRLGKRRPFLLLGIPAMSVALVLIWLPPLLCTSTACIDERVVIYFLLIILVYYFGFSIIRSSYLSMLPEQAQDDRNRLAISGLQGTFSIVATILGILLPNIFQSLLQNPKNPFHTNDDGRLLLTLIPLLAGAFAGVAIAVTLFAFFSVDERFHKAGEARERTPIGAVLRGIFKPFGNKENGRWLATSFLMNTAMRMITSILLPFMTFVLELEQSEFVILMVTLLPFAGAGFVFWQIRAKKGLKRAYVQSSFVIAVAMASAAVFLIWMDKAVKITLAYAIIAVCLFCLVVGYLLPNPIISKLVDIAPAAGTEQSASKKTQAGAYFGSYLFMLNIANTVGDIIFGLILAGGNAYNYVAIALFFPICACLYLASALVFRYSRIE